MSERHEEDCIHFPVCKFEGDQCCPFECGYFEKRPEQADPQPEPIRFWYNELFGVLVCDHEIEGISEELTDADAIRFRGRYNIRLTSPCAEILAKALGGALEEE